MVEITDSIDAMNKHAARYATPYQASNRVKEAAGARGATNKATMSVSDRERDDPVEISEATKEKSKSFKSLKSTIAEPGRFSNGTQGKALSSMMKGKDMKSLKEVGAMVEATQECSDPEDGIVQDDLLVITTTADKLSAAEKYISSEILYKNEVPRSLIKWDIYAAIFQLTQVLVLFIIANRNSDIKWFWYISYPDPGASDSLVPYPEEIGDFSVLWLLPIVPLLSGLQHWACVTFRETHEWYLERHQNLFRWVEYTFSASLMKIIIAQQVGITDTHLLVCLFCFMVITIQCGAQHEAINAKARSEGRPLNWRLWFISWFSFLVGWAIIWNYFAVFVQRGGSSTEVWLIVVLLFVTESMFALVFFLQWKVRSLPLHAAAVVLTFS